MKKYIYPAALILLLLVFAGEISAQQSTKIPLPSIGLDIKVPITPKTFQRLCKYFY
jgi:hypothetical protein